MADTTKILRLSYTYLDFSLITIIKINKKCPNQNGLKLRDDKL